jgi:hypothetical protein
VVIKGGAALESVQNAFEGRPSARTAVQPLAGRDSLPQSRAAGALAGGVVGGD